MPRPAPRTRTIAVITGSRADFGLLLPVMTAVAARRALRLRTIVTGAHLPARTWCDVADAGFTIHHRVRMQRNGQTGRAADVQSLAAGVRGLGVAFEACRPDVVVVLGDRIEALAAACAAGIGGFRLAHLHGGDRAEGVADESIRHAVSKLAHLHFAATARSRARLVRMGEDPRHVLHVGSTAVDGLNDVQADADAPSLIVAQHPIGAADTQERRWMSQTLQAALGVVAAEEPDGWILLVDPNADPGSDGIRRAIATRLGNGANGHRRLVCGHQPRHRFLAHLAGSRAIVGNSSAGLIEAAALRVACVNVGPRQAGRQKSANVVDCDYGVGPVKTALGRALRRPRSGRRPGRHPYGDGRAAGRIADVLSRIDLRAIPLRKRNTY